MRSINVSLKSAPEKEKIIVLRKINYKITEF